MTALRALNSELKQRRRNAIVDTQMHWHVCYAFGTEFFQGKGNCIASSLLLVPERLHLHQL